MKFVAAYLLACLGADSAATAEGACPTMEDVRRILGSVGADGAAAEEDLLDLLSSRLEGKDVAELVAAGRE
jgi:large subunit ribosomal protein LP2